MKTASKKSAAATKAVVSNVSDQLAKIIAKKAGAAPATSTSKPAAPVAPKQDPKAIGPVVMDPKKLAAEAVHGKPSGKTPAKGAKPAAPAPTPVKAAKAKKDEPSGLGLEALRMIQKGAKAVGNPASAHAIDNNPRWLHVGTGEDRIRVSFRKIKPYLREQKRTEEEVAYTLAAAALPFLKTATKPAATK